MDPVAGRVTARIAVRGELVDVVAAAGSVWVVDYSGHAVVRVNPRTNHVARRIALRQAGGGASGITATHGAIRAGQTQGHRDLPHRPAHEPCRGRAHGRARARLALLGGRRGLVLNIYDSTVGRLDAATRRVTATVDVESVPVNLEVVGTNVWVPNDLSNVVTRIDRDSATILEVIHTARNPAVVAGWNGDGG